MTHEAASTPENPAILPEQLRVMEDFVHDYGDHGNAKAGFATAIADNHIVAANQQVDPTTGEVIITAAAIGSCARKPGELTDLHNIFIDKMNQEFGMSPQVIGAFGRMQNRFAARPENTLNVADALSDGLSVLKDLQKGQGEDTTYARLAYLASAYAVSRDSDLRSAIAKDILRS